MQFHNRFDMVDTCSSTHKPTTRDAHMCKLATSKLAANGQQAGLTHVQVVASKLATHMHKTLVVASIFTMATHIRCSQDKVTPDKMAG